MKKVHTNPKGERVQLSVKLTRLEAPFVVIKLKAYRVVIEAQDIASSFLFN